MTALSDLPADVDLLVIGGGTAGLIAAKTAAGFGATALLVEAHRMGGRLPLDGLRALEVAHRRGGGCPLRGRIPRPRG
ncbi:MAG: hypothetical protein ACLGH5_04475 [Actinomycetes bacterium]